MKVRVLGCSGGIGGTEGRTTALLVDDDLLIDAGTGVFDLPLEALAVIDHVFVTHSHLDHIAALPLLIDAVADLRDAPLFVHAAAATLEALRAHIFNWDIWPDFSQIAVAGRQVMHYVPMAAGQSLRLGGRTIAALPAEHSVPALGYHLDSGSASLVFSGDTTINPPFWEAVNRIDNLRYLILETAFADRDEALARTSKHLCPRLLQNELRFLKHPAEVYVTHLKPWQAETIAGEVRALGGPTLLRAGHLFEF